MNKKSLPPFSNISNLFISLSLNCLLTLDFTGGFCIIFPKKPFFIAFSTDSRETSSWSLIIPTYSLFSPRKYPVNLQALFRAIGKTPVTFGSRVPKWLVFPAFIPASFSLFLTKSETLKLVGPEGLSMFKIPNSRRSFVIFFFLRSLMSII